MRRSTSLAVLIVTLMVLPALPALGQDLEEWLERAANAEYSGRQFTLCDTPDGRRVEIVEVAQRDGFLEVRAGFGSSVVSADGIYERSADGTMSVTSVETLAGWKLADRYHVEFGPPDEVLQRPVDVLKVMEGEIPRMELSFDRESGAVLEAEVFNSDLTRYCTSSFLTFEAASDDLAPPAMIAKIIQPAIEHDERLPATLAGFVLKDAYEGPSDSVTGFYSDGLFSFTLVVADRRINVQGMGGTILAVIGGSVYDRAFTPGQSFHSWESRFGGRVLLGDLPLDLQESVLSELPRPGRPGFLTRVWRRFFG